MKNKIIIIVSCILAVLLITAVIFYAALGRKLKHSGTFPVSTQGSYPTVLTYHLISDEVFGDDDYLFVRPSEFEEQLKLLTDRGYSFLFAEEWGIYDGPTVMITVDDGYNDNYTEMFPLLKKYNAKATVFLITDMIGSDYYLSEEQIKEMSDSGLVSFQSHTVGHHILPDLSEEDLRAELTNSAKKIESITGKDVTAISYPGGEFSYAMLDIVAEYYSFGFTTKYPPVTLMYGEYNIPRYYIARGDGEAGLEKIIGE